MLSKSHSIDRAPIAEALRQAGLDKATALAQLALPAIRIATSRNQQTKLPIGASRFGGLPDVPPHFEWPVANGEPLSFLAQINLADVHAAGLPERGWLLFFYDTDRQPWGFDPNDGLSTRVMFVEGPTESLMRHERPPSGDEAVLYEPCSLDFASISNLPHEWDRILSDQGLEVSKNQWSAYGEVAETLCGEQEGTPCHHLLGYPQLVQDDMRGECQLVTHGIYCGEPSAYEDPRAPKLLQNTSNWRLLLQIDTDEDGPGWNWGDAGRLYFWITLENLAARRFEKCWLILQCG